MNWLEAVISAVLFCGCFKATHQTTKDDAREYLASVDNLFCEARHLQMLATYNYQLNTSDENLKEMTEEDEKTIHFPPNNIDWNSLNGSSLHGLANCLGLFEKPIDPQITKDYNDMKNKMIGIGNMPITYCLYKNKSICGDIAVDRLIEILDNAGTVTPDPNEIMHYWLANDEEWKALRKVYEPYVNVSNRLARASNFKNRADQWKATYDSPTPREFEKKMLLYYDQISPIYKHFISYIRQKYRLVYGKDVIPEKGPIPAHLLSIIPTTPYPNKTTVDITKELKKQNYTVMKMVQTIVDFYESIGFDELPEDFYVNSLFYKPNDSDQSVNCQGAVSMDFGNSEDYRLILCGDVDMDTMEGYAHEIAHILNYVGAKNQPCCFRVPPNEIFSEAMANSMALSFLSYPHLQRLGLVEQTCKPDKEVIINHLYQTFRSTVMHMPTDLVTDLWRWYAFEDKICPEDYNRAYWNLRTKFVGVSPPVNRSEDYLDAARYMYLDDTQEIGYFLQYIIEFQIMQSLCIKAGKFDPHDPNSKLYMCDLYGSKEVGTLLKQVYTLGYSKQWNELLEIVTGEKEISAKPILDYFQPFLEWLQEENEKNGEYIGWK